MRRSTKFFHQGGDRRSRKIPRNSRQGRSKQGVNGTSGGEYISIDLIFQILVLLPIKSLVRLNSVCKTWFRLINSSMFAEAHLKLAETSLFMFNQEPKYLKANTFFVDERLGLETFSIFPTRQEKEEQGHMYYLQVQNGNNTKKIIELNIACSGSILATCKGLVLVRLGKLKGIVVMNPITRKLIRYPLGTLPAVPKKWNESYGFMYSSRTRRYKVVHLFLDKSSYVGCEILSVGTRTWRAVDGPSLGLIRKFAQESVSAIGSLHWVPNANGSTHIVSMDINSEKFYSIELPTPCKRNDRVIEIWGCLGMFAYDDQMHMMDVWIYTGLDGTRWNKQHHIHINSLVGDLVPLVGDLVPLASSRNAKEILFESKSHDFFVYDCQNQEMKKIEMETKVGWRNGHYLPFVNSLISWRNS